MMELIELKSNRLISLLIFTILLGCQGIENKKDDLVLECLLDSYISAFSLEDDSIIFLSESQGWSDSTSIIRMQSFLKSRMLPHGELLQSNFRGIEIHFEFGELSSGKVDKSKLISNNLEWSKLSQKKVNSERIFPPEEFDEIQIIYNPLKVCIEEVIINSDKAKLAFKHNCKLCQE